MQLFLQIVCGHKCLTLHNGILSKQLGLWNGMCLVPKAGRPAHCFEDGGVPCPADEQGNGSRLQPRDPARDLPSALPRKSTFNSEPAQLSLLSTLRDSFPWDRKKEFPISLPRHPVLTSAPQADWRLSGCFAGFIPSHLQKRSNPSLP